MRTLPPFLRATAGQKKEGKKEEREGRQRLTEEDEKESKVHAHTYSKVIR